MISRSAFEAVGGFDERLSDYEDDDLFLRLLQAGYENVYLPQALSRWRVDPESSSCSQRIAKSRMIFAQKLIEAFPDDKKLNKFPARDLIAPRLIDDVLTDARRALRSGNEAEIETSISRLAFFDQFLHDTTGSTLPLRQPLITAIIPVYNGAPHLREAVESIFAQTLPPDEVIIVDDGSTDDSRAIIIELARERPIHLIVRENGGQSAARNTGVAHAHGDLLAFLDQDDVWHPNHLAELVKPFINRKLRHLGWSYSDLDEIDEAGDLVCRGVIRCHSKLVHPKLELVNCLRQDMFILPSATLISRDAFLAIGGFNEQLSGYEDDDLFLRLFRAGFDSAFLPMSLWRWRIYQKSSSYSPRMAISRLAYAKLLIERFPNDPTRSRYYVRELIAPRFFRSMSVDFRRCVLIGDRKQQKMLLDHLAFIVCHLRARHRWALRYLLIPALRVPLIALILATRHLPAIRLLR